jgi:hypothetical protein
MLALLCAVGCGEPAGPGPDFDGGLMQDGGDAGTSDLAEAPVTNGLQLIGGQGNVVLDTTSDDWAVVNTSINGPGPLVAVSLEDATQQVIDPVYVHHTTVGPVVMSWSNENASFVGTLTLWTAAGGAHVVAMASPSHVGSASPDGAHVLWADNGNGATLDLFVGDADGSNAHATTLTGVDDDPASCPLRARFAGGRFFVATCAAGVTSVSAIDPATGTVTPVASNVGTFFVDAAGDEVLTVDSSFDATVNKLAGGTVAVDSTNDFSSGFFNAAGDAVIFNTGDGKLQQVTLAGPSTATLVPAPGALVVQAVSPALDSVLLSTTVNANDSTADLTLVPLGGGPSFPLAASGVVAGGGPTGFGDAYTADGSFAIWFGDLAADGTGTVHAASTADGVERATFPGAYYVFAASGTVVALNDHVSSKMRADLYLVDLAGDGSRTLIATQAEALFQVSASGRYVLYDFYAAPDQAGAYSFKL